MRELLIIVILVGLVVVFNYGATLPDGTHYQLGFDESKGIHLLVDKR